MVMDRHSDSTAAHGHDHSAHAHHAHHHQPVHQHHPVPPNQVAAAAAGTIYTCPMHPEVRQDHPGSCPKCGMTLEPLMPSLDEEENPELKDFSRRFWWTLPFTIVVTVLAMWGHRFGWFSMATQSWIELLLSLPIVLWAGWPFFSRGWASVRQRSPNMWTLIGLGTGAAFVYSVAATVAPDVFPASFQAMGRVAVYFEAAVVIISLTLLGQLLELRARSQTSAAIKSLAGPVAEDRAPHCCGRNRTGRPARARARGRPPARAAGREGAGGRRRARGDQRRRRVHADRRAAARSRSARATR
jgi:Cu+-exporting ATPase